MKIPNFALGLFIAGCAFHASVFAADEKGDFDKQLNHTLAELNREARNQPEGPSRLAELIQRSYRTPVDELRWAVEERLDWGRIVAFAYVHYTTGRSFERMAEENAHLDFWMYTEATGMNAEKMANSLESFLKTAQKERNSRIFERLRASRRVQAMPDLGSGFGLFQEALDFRRIDPPPPTKIHIGVAGRPKGEQ